MCWREGTPWALSHGFFCWCTPSWEDTGHDGSGVMPGSIWGRDQTAVLSAFHSHISPHSHKFPSVFYTCQADSFLKSLLVIPWFLLNPTDPSHKQTFSLFISCFGNLPSLRSGSFGCPIFTCCFHSPFIQWVTIQDRSIRRFCYLETQLV